MPFVRYGGAGGPSPRVVAMPVRWQGQGKPSGARKHRRLPDQGQRAVGPLPDPDKWLDSLITSSLATNRHDSLTSVPQPGTVRTAGVASRRAGRARLPFRSATALDSHAGDSATVAHLPIAVPERCPRAPGLTGNSAGLVPLAASPPPPSIRIGSGDHIVRASRRLALVQIAQHRRAFSGRTSQTIVNTKTRRCARASGLAGAAAAKQVSRPTILNLRAIV